MDRMTRKTELGNYVLKSCVDCKYKDECGGYDVDCEYYLVRELGRLEDKIESGELVDSKEKALMLLSRGSGKSFMRLEVIEILTKYKNGMLVELPCKVGDTVYMPWEYDGVSGVAELTVNDIFLDMNIGSSSIKTNLESDRAEYMRRYSFGLFKFEDIGQKIFLTKAKAEAKLKELQDGEH